MARLVLTDASPLIGLARIDRLDWLHHLFGVAGVPAPVAAEVLVGEDRPDERRVRAAFDAGYLVLIEQVPDRPKLLALGAGEAACIRCALAHADPVLVVMDERLGRRHARSRGIPVTGTAALVGAAKQAGLVESARAEFARLLTADFRLSPAVIRAVLARVGE